MKARAELVWLAASNCEPVVLEGDELERMDGAWEVNRRQWEATRKPRYSVLAPSITGGHR